MEEDPVPPPPGGAGAATVIEAVPLTPEADALIFVVPAETPLPPRCRSFGLSLAAANLHAPETNARRFGHYVCHDLAPHLG